jgi:hypothetical protein
MNPFAKILISALLIWAISELSRRSTFLGATLASLPLVSILAMVWLWRESHDPAAIARFSQGVFWLVLPSLVLFLLLPPLLLRWRFSFPAALGVACAATAVAYAAMAVVLKRFGVNV